MLAATMPSPTACRPTSPTIRRREPISALTACGTPARKRSRHLRLKDGAFECAVLLVCCSGARRQHHAGEREEQRGDLAGAERSCSATAAVTTPITGTAM